VLANALLPSVSKRIEGFLRAAQPNAYCATCLARSLGLSHLYDDDPEALARGAMALLVKRSGFRSAAGECSLCERRKVVIRSA
jgi:hypothetical protein